MHQHETSSEVDLVMVLAFKGSAAAAAKKKKFQPRSFTKLPTKPIHVWFLQGKAASLCFVPLAKRTSHASMAVDSIASNMWTASPTWS